MKHEIKRFARLGIVAFVLWLAVYYWPKVAMGMSAVLSAASPLIYGAIIAYVVGILMNGYEKIWFPNSANRWIEKSRPLVCMLLSFVTIVAAVIFLFKLVVPQLLDCVNLLLKEIPSQIEKLVNYLKTQEDLLPSIRTWLEGAKYDWDALFRKMMTYVSSGATGIMTGAFTTATSIISAIPDIVFTLIFAMYMLLGRHTLLKQAKRLLNTYARKQAIDKVEYVMGVANSSFRNFIVGQVTEALILGALCTAGMLLLRLPYAAMTGAVVGFTALIPIMGAYIGTFVGAFMIFTVNPMQALVFVVFLLILQQIEGNLIYPHTVGSSIGLPGIWVLAAVTISGGLFGVPGMLIGVPAMATLYRLLKADVEKREEIAKQKAE